MMFTNGGFISAASSSIIFPRLTYFNAFMRLLHMYVPAIDEFIPSSTRHIIRGRVLSFPHPLPPTEGSLIIFIPLFEYIVLPLHKGDAMGIKCFISYKSSDKPYRDIIAGMGVDISAVPPGAAAGCYYDSCTPYKLRKAVFPDSTVTIYLIGEHSAENAGIEKQKYIKKELRASLCEASDGHTSGILGVVLPCALNAVFRDGKEVVDDSTVLKEFSENYGKGKRCCVLASWNDFIADPGKFIRQAHEARMKGAPV